MLKDALLRACKSVVMPSGSTVRPRASHQPVVFLAQRTQRVQGDDVLLGLADLEGRGVRDLDLPLGGLVGFGQLDLQVALLGDLDAADVLSI